MILLLELFTFLNKSINEMGKSIKSKLNTIRRSNISNKIHLENGRESLCGQKAPCLTNELVIWLTKGELRCQKCLKKYKLENY